MKKFIAIILPLLAIVACKNVEQYRKPIETLSADWEKATTDFTTAGTLVGALQSSLAGLKDSLTVDPKMKMDAMKTKLVDSLKTSFMSNMDGVTALANKVTSIASNWQTGTATLNTLKEGLTSGKLDATALTNIESLKTLLSETTTATKGITESATAAQASSMSIYDAFKAAMMPAATMKK